MFPFVIPGLGAAAKDSVVDMAWLNDMPAGRHGPVTVRDGRFVDGAGKRVKFLATNFTFGSCFPDHATASNEFDPPQLDRLDYFIATSIASPCIVGVSDQSAWIVFSVPEITTVSKPKRNPASAETTDQSKRRAFIRGKVAEMR